MTISTSDKPFLTRVKESENDHFMQQSVAKAQDAQWDKRTAAREELGNWEQWRDLGEQIRQHVIKYLPDYLEQFSDNVEKKGGHVFFAQTDEQAVNYIKKIAKEKKAHRIVKSKSMVTTEINLDKALLSLPETSLMETDLAEFILQEDNWDEPTHIVFPTLHKNRDQIQNVFKKLGYSGSNDPEEMAKFARKYLREYFMQADLGITGCNFAIADNGMINLVTNEGNADLTMAIPKTQIVVMGMERIVPSLKEAEVLDNMLSRSAVGQKLTSYCSFSGPQVNGESDGPTDFHVVILDNGRSNALGTDFEPVLQCIRCGACLNVCPIYRHIGGHGYGSIYPGPIGAVLSPVLDGYEKFGDLPFASSLCAACTETCPVRIPLHQLLIKHRKVMMDKLKMDHSFNNVLMKGAGVATSSPILFKIALEGAHMGSAPLSKSKETSVDNLFNYGHIEKAPSIASGWTDVRDLARPPKHSDDFRSWYKKHKKEQQEGVSHD
ncbi:LutB/LldF family L-lactate oxidation iron-sulfur protein [Liquorilactobacillus mali]|uniref:LutB/LldF family L-lactate oxidation iron-sulfur protein n=1 Tax=Liquorilactobacillus mali TaxID=1618 RepID=UPI0029532E17|nr:LutB/LldF family L-lactate oxidation iron-sulfur protein [Liquorilactobacillus mali]MDV7757686.1 iron-sulfur cluster-binding protein [Liquorilactobacillus mali]